MKFAFSILFVLCFYTFLASQPRMQLTTFAEGLDAPISMDSPDSNTFYVVQRGGTIVALENGQASETLLDISHLIYTEGEGGLLDMAFHPDYSENKTFYINFTSEDEEEVLHTYIAQLTVPQDSTSANPDSMMIVMDIVQPFDNHNGGQILFGPDSNLYIFTGDGGSGGDPQNYAQNLSSPLGKILRIHVDPEITEEPYYEIPKTNPFQGQDNILPEIWAYGLRNPWRSSFDSMTDSLWVADVGQGLWEEISVQGISEGGLNYGWKCYEGTDVFSECENTSSILDPVYVYAHDNKDNCENRDYCGRSVTGGYVYRGGEYPSLNGHYIFADFVTNNIWTMDTQNFEVTLQDHETTESVGSIASFFESEHGELYAISLNGIIYQITAEDVMTSLKKESYEEISIYPNPVANELNLKVSEFDKAQIYSLEGILMKEFQDHGNTIDVSTLPGGTYLIKINKNGQKLIGKFVKL